jgi:hypothetical protein
MTSKKLKRFLDESQLNQILILKAISGRLQNVSNRTETLSDCKNTITVHSQKSEAKSIYNDYTQTFSSGYQYSISSKFQESVTPKNLALTPSSRYARTESLNAQVSISSSIPISRSASTSSSSLRCTINELVTKSGVKDEREVLRYLFILEGQKLVSPFPEGDFTSRTWMITQDGIEAVRNLERMETQ